VRLIGYWRSEQEPDWPDPHDFVDPDWDPEERLSVYHYLCGGWTGLVVPGIEECRICGQALFPSEKFDGTYVWPNGLDHYVGDHSVRLPREFLDHVHQWGVDRDNTRADILWWRSVRPD
jgi:hypothetical protein